jgi:sugar lactone lactonase YvrE
VIDLGQVPPTLSEFLSDPPVYAPNGGTFHNGKIVWGASGGNNSIGGSEQRVSIRTLDPATNKTTSLLNNYYGFYFNNIDDLAVHTRTGDIWFTDPRKFYHCRNHLVHVRTGGILMPQSRVLLVK